jgi:hypothetical protein
MYNSTAPMSSKSKIKLLLRLYYFILMASNSVTLCITRQLCAKMTSCNWRAGARPNTLV